MEPLFDRRLLIQRKRRVVSGAIVPADYLLARAVDEMVDRLSLIDRRFPHAITLFDGSDRTAAALVDSGKVDRVTRIESDPLLLGGTSGIVEPEERLPVARESADLVVSLLSMHAVNDLPGMLAQIRQALRPDGLFIGAFPGAGSLAELRESLLYAESALDSGASPRIYPFADIRDAGSLLQRTGFALPVTDMERVTVRFGTMFDLMRDLRAMGETNALAARSRKPVSRAVFLRAAEYYSRNFAGPDGRIQATFNMIWLAGWAPHPSQQRPLRPGSARASLAETLERMAKEGE